MADWSHADPAAGAAFAAAPGDVELQADGTMVDTREGWREMRLAVYAKRPRGRPAAAAEWDTRRPPPPSARVPFAGVETAARFGPRLRRWAARLGVRDAAGVTAPADGADRIRNQARLRLPGADGVRAHLAAARAEARSAAKRSALSEAAGYFARRADALGYAGRLAAGQSIGSGLVEGACKQVIGRRMKQTGARWRVRRANRMATPCCTLHGDARKAYWDHRLN